MNALVRVVMTGLAIAGLGVPATTASATIARRPVGHTVGSKDHRPSLPLFVAGHYRGRRPRDIGISGDGGNIVTGLRWSSWGTRSAHATGISDIQNCVPNCAQGTDTPVKTTISLTDPSATGVFTKLVEHRDGQTETFRYVSGHPDNWPEDAS